MKDKIVNKDKNSFYIRRGKIDIDFTKYEDGEIGVLIESEEAREGFTIDEEDVQQLIKWLSEQYCECKEETHKVVMTLRRCLACKKIVNE